MIHSFVSLVMIYGLTILAGCAGSMLGTGSDRNQSGLKFGHVLLDSSKVEEAGYGLYSYLLFASPPTDANRNLYLQAISTIIEGRPNIKSLEEAGFRRWQLNVTYIPIRKPAPFMSGDLSTEARAALNAWLLNHYDYNRAEDLLKRLSNTYRGGPYIISTLRSLSSLQSPSEPHLRQDLSIIRPHQSDLLTKWVQKFLEENSQQRWDESTIRRISQRLRETIAVAFPRFPGVEEAIVWVRPSA